MEWVLVLQLAVLGFTVFAILIAHRDWMCHLRRLHLQSQNTWNAIQSTHGHIEGLHEKYAKLYHRVNELERD